jgi:tight adherence protein C
LSQALAAAVLTGLTVASVVLLVVRPTRRLGGRVAPYAQRERLRMGKTADPSLLFESPSGGQVRVGVFAPIVAAAAERLAVLTDTADSESLARRLRHAGHRDMTPEQYRMRQLGYAARGAGVFAVAGLVVVPTAGGVLAMALLGAVWGVTRCRARIDREIARRRESMRAELTTVTQLLAVHIRAGTAPMVAVEAIARRSRGAVAEDLEDALDWITDGAPSRTALDQLADATAEPAAARVYRLLATSDIGDGDTLTQALLATTRDLRNQQREEIERLAVRRRFLMLVPTIAVMGPVMFLFLAAPIPDLFFGSS